MTDKEFISQLNKLRNVKTDQAWLNSNRELLLTQISNSGGAELSSWQNFVINFQSFMKTSSRPAFALGTFVVLLIVTSIFGHKLFSQAKPNDSLYIARIISEKAKLGTVLDSQERDRLAFQFAAGHAQDISTVLANPEFINSSNQDQIAKLNESFEKEINTARTKASRLTLKSTNEEEIVMIADATSTDGYLEVAEKTVDAAVPVETPKPEKLVAEEKASSTDAVPTEESIKADQILDEAKQSFERKDYNGTLNKLQEAQAIIQDGSR